MLPVYAFQSFCIISLLISTRHRGVSIGENRGEDSKSRLASKEYYVSWPSSSHKKGGYSPNRPCRRRERATLAASFNQQKCLYLGPCGTISLLWVPM
ncbi:hypothetical protein F4825DRAFT_387026 [Nemania diffusa]|nr:hypothetical protein F4825DRAFT_387026 [Nemania diffusa]